MSEAKILTVSMKSVAG